MEKNFLNARIKELRKSMKLNQAEFGEQIGLKTSAISKMEQEGSTVTEQNIKLICEKFHVRREWLTEGTGEMFSETEDTLFKSFAERYHLSPDDQSLASYLLQMTSEERQKVTQFIVEMAEIIKKGRSVEEPPFFDHGEAYDHAAHEMSLEAQEEAEHEAIRAKYQALREGKTAAQPKEPPTSTQEKLPLDPNIEERTAKFRARLYAQDKTRRILTGSDDFETASANKKSPR